MKGGTPSKAGTREGGRTVGWGRQSREGSLPGRRRTSQTTGGQAHIHKVGWQVGNKNIGNPVTQGVAGMNFPQVMEGGTVNNCTTSINGRTSQEGTVQGRWEPQHRPTRSQRLLQNNTRVNKDKQGKIRPQWATGTAGMGKIGTTCLGIK